MQTRAKISMPHRHTVVYETEGVKVSFEVEILSDGIVFYTDSPKILGGGKEGLSQAISGTKAWLEHRFSKVEIDNSPPPTFMI